MLKFKLQRFAEDEPIDIDVHVDDPIDEPIDDIDPVDPEPHPISLPTPPPMPSGVSGEAWRNVEELLVTLSNNVRVGMNDIRDDIKTLLQEVRQTGTATRATLDKLGLTMDEFKTLLAAATVETDEPIAEDKTGEPVKKRSSGYLSRRKGR